MQFGIIKNVITGKFRNYVELKSLSGYCFYDADLPENERIYMTYIATPILDDAELERKYIIVYGNADKLNAENTENLT